MAQKILIVDDEPKLVRLVREVLTASGYEVVYTGSGEEAVELVALESPSLVLLDIVLTGEMDGYQAAQRIREFSDLPIIMLTAKARESDLLRGYEAGADDYLTKPFSSKELLARIKAVLKRSRQETSEGRRVEISCGQLHIDLARRKVLKEGGEVHLTRTEFNLLAELCAHPNQVIIHEQLLTNVWGPEYRDDIDYLRAYIRYLRRKLEPDPANPSLIQTHQGVGYLLNCPEADRQLP